MTAVQSKRVSRQRLHQRRNRELGLCELCPMPAKLRADGTPTATCDRCYDKRKAYRRSTAGRIVRNQVMRRMRDRRRATRVANGEVVKSGAPLGKPHRCSLCGEVGHKKPTCSNERGGKP